MSKIKQILRLYSQGISKKKIAVRLSISKNTVKSYLERFNLMKITIDDLLKQSDFELDKLFNPPRESSVSKRFRDLHNYFPYMERQMRRRGMTIAKQHQEYKTLHSDGYGPTQFYIYYSSWITKVKPVMHIEHKVGDKLYIDYAGATLPYVDEATGEIKRAQVFVAILGWSQFAYVEALRSQNIEEFISGSENALIYIGGVPLALVPDNLKSAVTTAKKYEPELNENFKAFADHYGASILPARARSPQDKAHVENMVKLTYQRIYANLPENQVLTLDELNDFIRHFLEISNNTLLTGLDVSRTDRLKIEKESLQPLPEMKYEMKTIKQVTLSKNCHIHLHEDHHYYSAPYQYIGKKLKMLYSRSTVELYFNYELIATHKRLRSPGNYSTNPAHLPAQHQYVTEWSPSFFIEKAKEIDPVVELYIREVIAKKMHPEQAYKSCQGIISFAKRVGTDRLIKACKRAHEIGYYNYKTIEDILKKNLDNYEEESAPAQMPAHENIRGSNYYQ